MNLITSRLAAKARVRQIEASIRAERAANAADRAVAKVWGEILDLLQSKNKARARFIFAQLFPETSQAIASNLHKIAIWGHKTTVQALKSTLPARYLRVCALRIARESRELREDKNKAKKYLNPKPGTIQFRAKDTGELGLVDLGTLLREPVRDMFSLEQQKDIFAALLFPPPDAETLEEIIYQTVGGVTWYERLQYATKYATPQILADIVNRGFLRGATPQEIAKELLPGVNNVRSTARRIARTESMRVSHEIQLRTWDGLGDLLIGYQIHATLDQHTRPAHAARNGFQYFNDPTPGQRSMDECPRPPLESPRDGSVIAWNCRCALSPLLEPDPALNQPEA